MASNRDAMLNILAETQKLMHQRRVQGLMRSANTGALATSEGGALVASGSGALVPTAPGDPNPHERVRSLNYIGARDNRSDFFDSWSRKIEAFVNDSTQTALDLPAELDSNDRRVLHQLADKFNLVHTSVGKGTDRHLVLKKDVLFYRAATKVIDRDAIEALKNKQEAAHGSRFHLRRVHNDVEGATNNTTMLITNGDDDENDLTPHGGKRELSMMEKALNALDRATNQYVYATEQDGSSAVAGGSASAHLTPASSEANRYLSHNKQSLPPSSASGPHSGNIATASASAASVPGAWAAAMAQHKKPDEGRHAASAANNTAAAPPSHTVLKDVTTFEEQCTTCNTSSALDYDVSQWAPIGHCESCGRDSVFRLVEKKKRVVVTTASSEGVVIGAKRPREEEAEAPVAAEQHQPTAVPAAPVATKRAESIEKEDMPASATREEIVRDTADGDEEADEEEELIPLETDDLVSMLECNDHDPSFVGWMRSFANTTLGGDADAIGARVQFVMELGDVTSRGPSKGLHAQAPTTEDKKRRLFCKLSASASAMEKLLDDVWSEVFSSSPDVVIALPNMSVAGIDVEMVLHGPVSTQSTDAAAAIKARVGSNHFVFGGALKAIL